jgi:2,4-dienoyl-CoA reductase-like NADH-dependent reductase (Old Yellow Enzyme family)
MTNEEHGHLFDEINIGSVRIGNRFVRSATHECLAQEDGGLTDRIQGMYERLATGKVGLITSGYSYVLPCGKGSNGQQGIYDDHLINGYMRASAAIRKHGSRFFIQVVHCGKNALVTKECPQPLAPSGFDIPGTTQTSKEMTEAEILKTIDAFVEAIRRARVATADGVQLHCAHGFLLSSFLSPYLNRREDDWGGDTERRARIVVEIIRRGIIANPGFPITAKMNVYDGVEGGTDMEEAKKIAKILDEEGIAAIETSGGIGEGPKEITCQEVMSPSDEAYFKEYSRAIKRIVSCPVILVGGMRSIPVMRRILEEGYADMISLSRPLIREPNLIEKFAARRSTSSTCKSCNKCFDANGLKCNYGKK